MRCLVLALFSFALFINIATIRAQNTKIKCYFNHPVNNSLSIGIPAVYLNTTFPDTITAYINRAKYTLDFAIYDFTSTGSDNVAKIATAVNNAYARGVVVRWINNGSSSNTGMSLLNSAIPVISSPTTSSYGIMHNKFLVIDANSTNTNDPVIITGSYNYSQQQSNTDYNNLLIIQDKNVAQAYYNQFNQMWGGTAAKPNTSTSVFGPYKTTSPTHYFNVNGTIVQVHFSPKDTCGKYLNDVVNSANNDLTFGIYTFTDNTIATCILNMQNKKVKVRGIMDQFSKTYSPYTTLSSPLGSNMVVYTGTGLYHNKILVVDALLTSSDPQLATGSFNWTSAAETKNDENLIIIHDATIANEYYQSLCRNITDNGGAACITPVPVKWVNLQTSLFNNATTINWETTDEVNNNHFEIEHSSNGVDYKNIGSVIAKQSNQVNHYQFLDVSLNEGINYYRIKQVDNNGGFTYSNIVSVYNRNLHSLLIYPNPVINQLNVLLPSNALSLIITNTLGQELIKLSTVSTEYQRVDVSKLSRGTYNIIVLTNSGKEMRKFIKE